MLKLLGLKSITTTKNAYHMRTLLELPLCEPIDMIQFHGRPLPAVAMKQQLITDSAAKVMSWKDGTPAVTDHKLGSGRVLATGTLIGTSYMKSAIKQIPWARGGRHVVYNPTGHEIAFHGMIGRGIPAEQPAICRDKVSGLYNLAESIVLDHKDGTLVTLVNWANAPLKDVEVAVRMKDAPKTVRTVSGQRNLEFTAKDGVVTFRLDLAEADYVLLMK
jgi:hypothetical protein